MLGGLTELMVSYCKDVTVSSGKGEMSRVSFFLLLSKVRQDPKDGSIKPGSPALLYRL